MILTYNWCGDTYYISHDWGNYILMRYSFPELYDLPATLDCGQAFRFRTDDPAKKIWYAPVEDRILKVWQEDDPHVLYIDSNKTIGLQKLTDHYFRREDDYLAIERAIAIDSIMQQVVEKTAGLHLLRQPVFECAVSFFLSQCSNIPRIKAGIEILAEKYGDQVEFDGKTFHLFPTRDQLAGVTAEQMRALKFGYRADYIAEFLHDPPECFDILPSVILNTEDFSCTLQKMEGVGQKVADCIQLFGFGDLKVFPVDVWIQRFMQEFYFNNQPTNEKKIRGKGQMLFGNYAGYAQQRIFHYIRIFMPKPPRNFPKRQKKSSNQSKT
jgi:N-glycosylase/DNA lyase